MTEWVKKIMRVKHQHLPTRSSEFRFILLKLGSDFLWSHLSGGSLSFLLRLLVISLYPDLLGLLLTILHVILHCCCNCPLPSCWQSTCCNLPEVEYGALVCSDLNKPHILDSDGKSKPVLEHEEEDLQGIELVVTELVERLTDQAAGGSQEVTKYCLSEFNAKKSM